MSPKAEEHASRAQSIAKESRLAENDMDVDTQHVQPVNAEFVGETPTIVSASSASIVEREVASVPLSAKEESAQSSGKSSQVVVAAQDPPSKTRAQQQDRQRSTPLRSAPRAPLPPQDRVARSATNKPAQATHGPRGYGGAMSGATEGPRKGGAADLYRPGQGQDVRDTPPPLPPLDRELEQQNRSNRPPPVEKRWTENDKYDSCGSLSNMARARYLS